MTTAVSEYLFLRPNWAAPVHYSRKWRTSIQSGITGGEVRSALFTWPRRTLSYRVNSLSYAEQAYLKQRIFSGLSGIFGVPCWQDLATLSAQANAGTATLGLNEANYRNFEEGGLLALGATPNMYEVKTIETITGDTITLTENLVGTWSAGSEVYPLLKGRVSSGAQIGARRRDLGEIDLMVAEAFDDAPTRHVGDASAFSTFDSLPVFDLDGKPDSLKQKFRRPSALIQWFGKQLLFDQYDETAIGYQATFERFSKAEIRDVLDFFDAQRGRWGTFYLPSSMQDVEITAAFGATDKILQVTDIDFSSYWDDTNAGRALIIFWPDGTWKAQEIVSAGAGTIRLNAGLGKSATSDEVPHLMAAFLDRARFDQDEITIEYKTQSIAETELSFRTVKWTMPALTTTTTTTTTTTSTSTSTSTTTV